MIRVVTTTRQKPRPSMNASSHLKDYLDYYCSLDGPGYAVLVTGDWGSGKTFQVREAIANDQAYYVSLFGLSSADDVIALVYATMFPKKALIRRIAENVGEATADIPGIGSLALNGVTAGMVGVFLRQDINRDKPIIFDDLERCCLKQNEILGIINLYVEHHRCRVIVIAHDEKIVGRFSQAKEKIFGQTLKIYPQIESAYRSFCVALPRGSERGILSEYGDNIIRIFRESDVQSLRILRHVVEDISRLDIALTEKHRGHRQAMAELVQLFSAIDIEWRASRLVLADFYKRNEKEFQYNFAKASGKVDHVSPWVISAQKRYGSINVTSTLLQDDILKQMLVDGRYDVAAIRESLDASAHFLEPHSAAPWQIVSAFRELDDVVVADGLARMQEQFDRRQVLDSGEILHIFALRMLMANEGVLDGSVEEIVAECKSYVDDLLSENKLPPRNFGWRWREEFSDSAHGVGYWVLDSYRVEFSEISKYLVSAKERALENLFPSLAIDLLKILLVDGQKFYTEVCYSNQGDGKYASIPVLSALDPKAFVAAWMESPKTNWYWISSALQERYSGGRIDGDLKKESGWIGEVIRLLNEEENKASGFQKYRIRLTIPKIPGI